MKVKGGSPCGQEDTFCRAYCFFWTQIGARKLKKETIDMDRLWLAQLISSWFNIFNKSHSLTPSKVWEKKGLGTIIRVFFSLCLSFISTSQNMEVCRRSDVELCWWLPRASNQQATLLPGRRFSWYGLRQSDIILFLDIFSYDIISYDINLVYQISFRSLISFDAESITNTR